MVMLTSACHPSLPETPRPLTHNSSFHDYRQTIKEVIQTNPCGYVYIKRPLTNVTGHLTATVRPGSEVRLFTVANLSLDAALYAATNCRSVGREPILNGRQFTFHNLPMGSYVVMVPARDFEHGQGFPVIPNQAHGDRWLSMAFHGGDEKYSLAVFTIGPLP
jgi:hypothetical protein